MKSSQRLCCVLLCCLLLSGVFSVTAKAEEVPIENLMVEAWGYARNANSGSDIPALTDHFIFYPGDGTVQKTSPNTYINGGYQKLASMTYHWKFSDSTGAPLFLASSYQTFFKLTNAYYSFYANSTYYRNPSSIRALVYYVSGGTQYFDVTDYTISGTNLSLDFEFTPTEDVISIEFIITQDLGGILFNSWTYYFGEFDQDGSYSVITDKPSREEGLLSGILDKAKDIVNNIKDGFNNTVEKISNGFKDTVDNLKEGFKNTVDNLKEGFKNVVDGITDLPEKLWEKISQGLLDLFVPDEDYLVEYKDRMDEFLAQKFGAIYQVVQVTFESWERITDADEQNSIQFPETTIQITNDTSFSFGPYEVPIVPSGFEWLTTILKTVCGIVCTILFVNGLRKRYDEVMGVEK